MQTPSIYTLTPEQLRRAAELKDQVQALGAELSALLGGQLPPMPESRRTNRISEAGRERIAAAARRRWAKYRAQRPPKPEPKRKITAEGKRRLSQLAKARWAKVRAAGRNRL